jgi:hypothetical protein
MSAPVRSGRTNGVCLRAIEKDRGRLPTFFALNRTLPMLTLVRESRQTDSLIRTVTAWAAGATGRV